MAEQTNASVTLQIHSSNGEMRELILEPGTSHLLDPGETIDFSQLINPEAMIKVVDGKLVFSLPEGGAATIGNFDVAKHAARLPDDVIQQLLPQPTVIPANLQIAVADQLSGQQPILTDAIPFAQPGLNPIPSLLRTPLTTNSLQPELSPLSSPLLQPNLPTPPNDNSLIDENLNLSFASDSDDLAVSPVQQFDSELPPSSRAVAALRESLTSSFENAVDLVNNEQAAQQELLRLLQQRAASQQTLEQETSVEPELVIPGLDLTGTQSADQLSGDEGDDVLRGERGNDELFGKGGDDEIYGGSHKDILYGGDGDDRLFGEKHNDQLYGGDGADTLFGGRHHDMLYGEAGDDVLYGDESNDQLYGGDGVDQLHGGTGNDILYGGADADHLSGDQGNDKLYGEAGADVLLGGDGHDDLYGGDGDDTLDGGNQNDDLYGGDGNDRLLDLAGKNKLYGEAGNDQLTSGDKHDKLYGGSGQDILIAAGGSDYLDGGDDADRLYGGSGNDTLLGGAGADYLVGGAGADHLIGGTGADIFTWHDHTEAGRSGQRDTVKDFNVNEDSIDLSGFSETIYLRCLDGLDASLQTLSWQQKGDHTFLQYNYQGNSKADFEVKLNQVVADELTSAAFKFGNVVGSGTNEILVAGRADSNLNGGAGDDILVYDQASLTDLGSLVGGTGIDTVAMAGTNLAWDFSAIDSASISGIERIDIRGTGDNSARLSTSDVLDFSDNSTIFIQGDIGDTVQAVGDWQYSHDLVQDDVLYSAYVGQGATLYIDQSIGNTDFV